jgi:hypothetical protein
MTNAPNFPPELPGLEPTDPFTAAEQRLQMRPEDLEELDPNNLPVATDIAKVAETTATQTHVVMGGATGTKSVDTWEVSPGIHVRDPSIS